MFTVVDSIGEEHFVYAVRENEGELEFLLYDVTSLGHWHWTYASYYKPV